MKQNNDSILFGNGDLNELSDVILKALNDSKRGKIALTISIIDSKPVRADSILHWALGE